MTTTTAIATTTTSTRLHRLTAGLSTQRRLRWCGLVVLLLAGVGGCSQQIRWYPDYGQAQPVAQRESRPMLLYFWDWLSRDRVRAEEIFSDPEVVAAMQRTVNVRLEEGWFRDQARKYDVRESPTFILTDPQGVEESRLTGIPTPEAFVRWLEGSLQRPATTQPADGREGAAGTGPAAE